MRAVKNGRIEIPGKTGKVEETEGKKSHSHKTRPSSRLTRDAGSGE